MCDDKQVSLYKAEQFAVRVYKLYKYLKSKNEYDLAGQILRSGTSIGANIAESKYAASAPDFINKMQISAKECAETLFWLRFLKNTDCITQAEFDSIYADGEELIKILTASINTKKNNCRATKSN